MNRSFLAFVLLLAGAIFAFGQSSTPSPTVESRELFETIAKMDAKLFDAFNAHNLDALMALFTDDLEFYQDNDGLKSYAQSKDDFTKLFTNNPGIKRDLVAGSLEVYPVKDYGAIEIGAHRFCHKESSKGSSPAQTECGTFKFTMVWRKSGDSWRISRVISYGH